MDEKSPIFFDFFMGCEYNWVRKNFYFSVNKMRNKKLHLIMWLVLTMFVGVVWSFTSAVSFTLEFWEYIKSESWWAIRQNMVPIHFNDNWNDFHWFIYFSDGIVEATWWVNQRYLVTVAGGAADDKLECQKKVKWFYYNAERGERLRPLDGGYGGIIASGWIYTRCRQAGYSEELKRRCKEMWESEREACEKEVEKEFVDSNGYYWIVTHNYNWETIALVAWTNYLVKGSDKWITPWTKLSPTFVRIGNQYPVWFIYDGNWWAWFVWCEIRGLNKAQDVLYKFNTVQPIEIGGTTVNTIEDWHNLFTIRGDHLRSDYVPVDCNDGWTAMNSLIKVVVDGLVGVNKGPDNGGIQWNQSNPKMQYFWSVSVNNMQLINYARQRAEVLCRWKWRDSYASNEGGIVCVSSDTWEPIIPSVNETLIVKWWADVQITDMENYEDDGYYDIFVDGGNLLIDVNSSVSDLTVFKKNWFKSESSLSQFKTAVSEARKDGGDYSGEDVAAWRFIRWNFIVNWNIKPASWMTGLQNVYFIYWKMTSKDTVDKLEETFVWKCNVWSGSDLEQSPCPGWWKDEYGNSWINPYQNASLVIIDQNYPSPLYQ